MKEIKLFAMLIIALVAMTGCKDDDEPGPATVEQMEMLTGHWYADLPLVGETDNWRTIEEGDVTGYNNIAVVIYLNGAVPDACFWRYLYMQDNELVNYDGLFRTDKDANFTIQMDSEGNITPSSHMGGAPVVTNMRYDFERDIITADVSFKGYTLTMTFYRPNKDQESRLSEIWAILSEEGIIGGDADDTSTHNTNISGGNATEPSRAKKN